MKFEELKPPRTFRVGRQSEVEIHDCGRIRLQPDEMVTFITSGGRQYDVTAKSWGFYATPSLNGRLQGQGFKSALVREYVWDIKSTTIRRCG